MGRFPIRAMSGNQYIMLAFHEQANAILVQPFKTKADTHRVPAYNVIMNRLKKVIWVLISKSWTMKPVPHI